MAMVFGNMGDTSATGVCFSRDAANGENLFNGEYLVNAQGEDVVAGIRTPQQYIEDKEANSIGQRAMSQLPYNWRRIVEMREREDMSFAEIAQVLGTSESSCRGMMSKARQKILQLISKMTR
jgi:RNA polymerase sigma factor (sigma-70 family)